MRVFFITAALMLFVSFGASAQCSCEGLENKTQFLSSLYDIFGDVDCEELCEDAATLVSQFEDDGIVIQVYEITYRYAGYGLTATVHSFSDQSGNHCIWQSNGAPYPADDCEW